MGGKAEAAFGAGEKGALVKKIRIAVIGTRGFPGVQGGVESHCQNLYPLLVENGCDVTVFTRAPYIGETVREYRGVKLVALGCPRNPLLETIAHTFLCVVAVARMRPDIVHIHAIGPSIFVPVLRFLGLRVVMTHHGFDYERKKWGRLAKIALRAGESFGARNANSIIAISRSVAARVRKRFNRNVIFIPNGVRVRQPAMGMDSLGRFGLESGRYIMAIGRFVPEKGFHDLIEAFRLLKIDQPETNWKLAIVGQADHKNGYSSDLERKAAAVEGVVLTGFLEGEPLHQVYSHAGLFVLPSYCEGLSIALLEALGYGLSCITSDIEANRNAGLEQERLFAVADPRALCVKMRHFIANPVKAEERQAQIERVCREYDWPVIARKTCEVYSSCAGVAQESRGGVAMNWSGSR